MPPVDRTSKKELVIFALILIAPELFRLTPPERTALVSIVVAVEISVPSVTAVPTTTVSTACRLSPLVPTVSVCVKASPELNVNV